MRQKLPGCYKHLSLALIATLFAPFLTSAQEVTDSALKAAFIYNVAKFTKWPEETPAAKAFPMCVFGDAAVEGALARSTKGRLLSGTEISVTAVTSTASLRGCRLLYLSGVTKEQAAEMVAGVQGAPVLTISDLSGFKESGGIVEFFFQHGQLRFTIGLESARKSGLQLSAKLITLSKAK